MDPQCDDPGSGDDLGGGWSDPVPTRRRLGQGMYQAVVLDAYGHQCAATSEKAVPALDAAHIRPFADRPIHEITNGVPGEEEMRPSGEALRWHSENRFKG